MQSVGADRRYWPWSHHSCRIVTFFGKASGISRSRFFQIKLLLVLAGTSSAVSLHWSFGMILEGINKRRRISHLVISLLCWPGALIFGRLIAFADG